MPGLYGEGEFEVVGACTGACERGEVVTGEDVRAGDAVIGLPSSGLHTNGYTLARKVLEDAGVSLADRPEPLDRPVGEVYLEPHRAYVRVIRRLREDVYVRGMAHITGGGIPGNLVRILPQDCTATVDPGSWELPPLFTFMQQAGQISPQEMREVFNLGAGLIAVLPLDAIPAAQSAAMSDGVTTWVMGEIERGTRTVRFARP